MTPHAVGGRAGPGGQLHTDSKENIDSLRVLFSEKQAKDLLRRAMARSPVAFSCCPAIDGYQARLECL